jgi:8-oxo-dGTP pyrophosphatase MutT (NUDIX family)
MNKGTVIIMSDAEGKILWQLRDTNPKVPISFPGYWNLPSGGQELADGGDIQKTAARELEEETGYKANPEEFNILFTSVQENPVKGPVERYVVHINYDGKQPIQCFEGEKMEFHSLEEMKTQSNVFLDHIAFTSKYVESQVYGRKEHQG